MATASADVRQHQCFAGTTADLSVVKSGPPAPRRQRISYTIAVTNGGPNPASTPRFGHPPGRTPFLAISPGGWSAPPRRDGTGTYCTTLHGRGTANFTLNVNACRPRRCLNTATVSAHDDPNPPTTHRDTNVAPRDIRRITAAAAPLALAVDLGAFVLASEIGFVYGTDICLSTTPVAVQPAARGSGAAVRQRSV